MIHDKILVALGAFDSQGRVLPGSYVGKKTSAAGMLGRITIYTWGGAALIWLLDFIIHGYAGAEHRLAFLIIPALLGLLTFVGYILAMVVSAFKK